MTWEKLAALPAKGNPCLHCPGIAAHLHLESIIAVGFGSAYVTRDGEAVLDGERALRDGDERVTAQDAENLALADPDHDWRITLFGPLHGEEYQRQGDGLWVLVSTNEGFA